MDFSLKKVACALVLAAVIISAMFMGVSGLFSGGSPVSDSDASFTVLDAAGPNVGTNAVGTPDILEDGSHVVPDFNFDNYNDLIDFPFVDDVINVTKPGSTIDKTVMGGNGSSDNDNGSSNTNPNGGSGGSGGNGSSGGSSNTTTPTPPVTTKSNLASTIKSHKYTSGLDIFQSSKKDISTDTAALMKAIKKGNNKCSFIAVRISDGATIAYNANALYNCASSYKALSTLYTFKQADAGVYDLNTKIKYTSADYYPGSGIIRSSAVGTVYTLREIADYSIRYSDNTAFIMVQRYIGKNNIAEFAKKLGCPNYNNFYSTNWPKVSAIDAALWWAEIYNFGNSSTVGKQMYNIFLNATHECIKKALNSQYAVAHKSGSTSFNYHDGGIVHSEDPYLLIVYTNNPTNYSSDNQAYLAPIVKEIHKLINP